MYILQNRGVFFCGLCALCGSISATMRLVPIGPNSISSRAKMLLAFLSLFALAVAIRWPLMGQSLWYDEMYTLIHYTSAPWHEIVAGQYSPNNHILFTVLAKLLSPDGGDVVDLTFWIRLPSLIAGAHAAVALGWPVWRSRPHHAALIALIATVHPWLVSFSGWARGYALMMLLAILSTNLLPTRKQIVNISYALALAAGLYTQPIAIALIPGHAFSIYLLRRDLLPTWFRSAALAGLLALLFYLPFFVGAGEYFSSPQKPSISYATFLNQTFRFAQAGDNIAGIAAVVTPLLILTCGGWLAWRNRLATPSVITFTVASIGGLLLPLLIRPLGEVRAMLWLIPLYCIGATAILTVPLRAPIFRAARATAAALLLAFLMLRCYTLWRTPTQPILDAVLVARDMVGNDQTPIVGLYMASLETRQLYGGLTHIAYQLDVDASGLPALRDIESHLAPTSKPVVIVFYESFLQRDQPPLWQYLQDHYALVQRLPGRISPAAIYRKK